MKHNLKITLLILGLFVIAQVLGLFISNYYNSPDHPLPFGLEVPQAGAPGESSGDLFVSLLFSFLVALALFVLLTKLKLKHVLKAWFFIVVVLALGISFNFLFLVLGISPLKTVIILSLGLGIILAFFKVYKRDFLVHNITEILIYPGIASVFIPILNIYTMAILLVLISGYDAWAVWHSKLMVKMAKYQINELKTFSGFFIPYLTKSMKKKFKGMKLSQLKKRKKGAKVNVAILGGGDIVFPIITAGVVLKTFGLGVAIFTLVGALLGLSYIFFIAEKKKFYPAMPFITTGIIVGTLLGILVL